jgi:hypothetical protein
LSRVSFWGINRVSYPTNITPSKKETLISQGLY